MIFCFSYIGSLQRMKTQQDRLKVWIVIQILILFEMLLGFLMKFLIVHFRPWRSICSFRDIFMHITVWFLLQIKDSWKNGLNFIMQLFLKLSNETNRNGLKSIVLSPTFHNFQHILRRIDGNNDWIRQKENSNKSVSWDQVNGN